MDYDCDYCVHCLMNEETEEEFCYIGRTPPENDECKGLEYYEED